MPQPRTAESTSTLDNPVWWALTGTDCRLSEGGEKAHRYHAAVSPFAAVSDEYDPEAWAELAGLAAGSPVAVITSSVPDGWAELRALPVIQMVYSGEPDEQLPSTYDFTPLMRADVPEMLALAEQTKPGPFARSTIDLGGYRKPGAPAGGIAERPARQGTAVSRAGRTVTSPAQRWGAGRGG